jgi:ATP-dependent phosphoenolpyruvate carboxykinase
VANTGKHTGRSPRDRYRVAEPSAQGEVWWGSVNRPMGPATFDRLLNRLLAYLQVRGLFVHDGSACADPRHRRTTTASPRTPGPPTRWPSSPAPRRSAGAVTRAPSSSSPARLRRAAACCRVLPPLSRLTVEQVLRHRARYAQLLHDRLRTHDSQV